MARASLCIAAAVAVSAAAPAHAQKQVRVAIYAPWSGPSTADDRYAFSLEVQDAIEAGGHGPAKVSSFAKLKDFRRAVTTGTVDIAVVDGGATASLGKRLAVAASWSSGNSWVLAGSERFASLRNKRLALQARDAKSSAALVETLLRGEAPASYWSSIVSAPVTEDARQLVLRGKADVVVVPKRAAGELTALADLGSFSELAVATTDADRLSGALGAIEAAVKARFGGTWTAGKPKLPKPARVTRLAPAPLPDQKGDLSALLAPAGGDLSLRIERPANAWIEPDAP